MVLPNKLLFIDLMLERGINAYRGATQLAYVRPAQGYKDAENAKWMMEGICYLPIHSHLTDTDARDTIERVIDSYYTLLKYLKA
jgi:dTDP-4-amino-4,6-dideoxygalactose transaminase